MLNSGEPLPMAPVRIPPAVSRRLVGAVVCLLLGAGGAALASQTVLADAAAARNVISEGLWRRLVAGLGGRVEADGTADLGLLAIGLPIAGAQLACWLAGGLWIARRKGLSYAEALAEWGLSGWAWWLLPGGWELVRVIGILSGLAAMEPVLLSIVPFVFALALGGWLATFFALLSQPESATAQTARRGVPAWVWVATGLYTLVFTAMNWQLYFGLLVPHGDSAMYEEHLWNLTHGKGFRSYLDQGLFLGEHLQVIHVLLVPLHLLWPSHLLLELCESAALASGAIAVYRIARRHTGSVRAGVLTSLAYLLYVPMQFLDIAVDLKTFRPDAFGIPALLFALDQLERRRFVTCALLLLIALSAQESYAMVLAPLGVWIAPKRHPFTTDHGQRITNNSHRWFGTALTVFSAAYLLLAVTVVIPWFRSGADVHYTQYFGELGSSPGELLVNALRQPMAVLQKLLSGRTLYYALALLAPLGLMPLRSPGRLAVALPMFAVLSLMELSPEPGQQQLLIPFHHFHAPLVPIVVWAAAAGLGRFDPDVGAASRTAPEAVKNAGGQGGPARLRGPGKKGLGTHLVWCCALTTGIFFTLSPLGVAFWDPGSTFYWQRLYVPGERAERFARVYEQIPLESRVASTDLIHPRFTHHERSYDYSAYPRAVNDGKPGAPPDTDYIVVDVHGRYNDIRSPDQIAEYREHPERWDVLPDVTDGYFIVLRRRDLGE